LVLGAADVPHPYGAILGQVRSDESAAAFAAALDDMG